MICICRNFIYLQYEEDDLQAIICLFRGIIVFPTIGRTRFVPRTENGRRAVGQFKRFAARVGGGWRRWRR